VVLDTKLAREKLLTAVGTLTSGMESDAILRPSSCGQCPRRLWLKTRTWEQQGMSSEKRDPRFSWYALQGTVIEHLMRPLLRLAGAQVFDPPDQQAHFIDPVTGMAPHVDGAVLWPEVGILEHAFLEFKDLRAQAAIDILLGGLQADRGYWYQAVAYLYSAQMAVANMGWDIPAPRQLMLVLTPKDPSTTNMLMQGRLRSTQKERGESTKPMTAEEQARAEQKKAWRGRLEELGGIEFYFQLIHQDDPDVQQTWGEIKHIQQLLGNPVPPLPLHDPTLPEDKLDVECAAYCEEATACRDLLWKGQ
jgi:hypothetical protein